MDIPWSKEDEFIQQYDWNQPGTKPAIQNIVSTLDLGCNLNLKSIALRARNAEYNPKRFASIMLRIKQPKTTALIFSSGKMVCTGAKTEEDSKISARKFARIVQKLGFPVGFSGFKIQNIVGSCDVGFSVKLETMVCSHGRYAVYEPELFPGLIYKMMMPKVTVLVFASGKMVITGAKVKEDIFKAFDNIYPVLQRFKRPVRI